MRTDAHVEGRVMPSGIPALDRLLGGGLPRQQSIIITGEPGCGKTVLTSQIAFARAAAGERIVVATVTSESHDKLVEDLRSLSFFDQERIGNDLFFLNVYPWVKKGPKETREILQLTVHKRAATMLIFDGLRSVRNVWSNEAQLREFLYELNIGLLTHGCLGVFTAEYALDDLIKLPEATTLDGIISVAVRRYGPCRTRTVEIAKLRGRPHMLGEHHMRLDTDGVHIVPRLEAEVPMTVDFLPGNGRASSGLPGLDALLGGGLPSGSSTLLAGSTGVGKTLTALQFAVTGAAAGEPSVFVSFHEAPSRLQSRAAGIGLDIRPVLESGALTIRFIPPAEIEADEAIAQCLELIAERKARRFVLDTIGEIEHGMRDAERLDRLMPALTFKLRSAGVTSLILKEIPKIVGLDVDFSATPLAVAAENLILLRHVEIDGSVRRLISVLKMRESAYDDSVREFEITADGLRVLSRIRATDALTGLSEAVARQ